MYKIKKQMYGIYIELEGSIPPIEAEQWKKELIEAVRTLGFKEFGVFVDMRNIKTLPQESKEHIEYGQKYCRNNGMNRSVIILNSEIVTLQFQRIAKETGIDKKERYINAAQFPNWQEIGLNWIRRGIEPPEKN
jgi:hypothetical protein